MTSQSVVDALATRVNEELGKLNREPMQGTKKLTITVHQKGIYTIRSQVGDSASEMDGNLGTTVMPSDILRSLGEHTPSGFLCSPLKPRRGVRGAYYMDYIPAPHSRS